MLCWGLGNEWLLKVWKVILLWEKSHALNTPTLCWNEKAPGVVSSPALVNLLISKPKLPM